MQALTLLRQTWRSHWQLSPRRPGPKLRHLAISAAMALVIGLGMGVLAGAMSGNLGSATWLRTTLPANMLLAATITAAYHLAYLLIEQVLPLAWSRTVAGWRDWRAGLFHAILGLACVSLGGALGLLGIDAIWQANIWREITGSPRSLLQFLGISLLITGMQWLGWRARWRRQALQLAATEAQLKLLQAQIEPHFLFNTLANVQSLIDYDAERAKLMLSAFTDYLRASLQTLRRDDCSLDEELAMVECYLSLMRTRMDERLRYELQADEAARRARVPPLLLQPLVENAIQHGLEPKLEGGRVLVKARVEDGRLLVSVADDGLGLDAPRRAGRTGNGIALDNIRLRLATRYGESARLQLQPSEPSEHGKTGTRALLDLPYQTVLLPSTP